MAQLGQLTATLPIIRIGSAQTSHAVEFRQADNSSGISEESLKKITQQLFTTNSYGTGLGLLAVERILVRHGDGLDVISRLAQGAGFTAWFPLIQTQE
jgi:signal transduction histidine kinase